MQTFYEEKSEKDIPLTQSNKIVHELKDTFDSEDFGDTRRWMCVL